MIVLACTVHMQQCTHIWLHLQRDLFPGLSLFQFLIRYSKQSETRGGTAWDCIPTFVNFWWTKHASVLQARHRTWEGNCTSPCRMIITLKWWCLWNAAFSRVSGGCTLIMPVNCSLLLFWGTLTVASLLCLLQLPLWCTIFQLFHTRLWPPYEILPPQQECFL